MKKLVYLLFASILFCLPAFCLADTLTEAAAIKLTAKSDYVVKAGETLWGISRNIYHSGKYWEKIFHANALETAKAGYPIIVAGQKITIPALTGNEVMAATYVWPGDNSTGTSASSSASGQSAKGSTTASTTQNHFEDNFSSINSISFLNGDKFLYRIAKDCATGEPTGTNYPELTEFKQNQWIIGHLQAIDLSKNSYQNYTCASRYQEQCIDDGSFDGYYEEWCSAGVVGGTDYAETSGDSSSENNSSAQEPVLPAGEDIQSQIRILISNGAELLQNIITNPSYDNQRIYLFRIPRSCATGKPTDPSYPVRTEFKHDQWIVGNLQMIDLAKSEDGNYDNYTCHSRFQEQCIDDGSFDGYYDELCVQK